MPSYQLSYFSEFGPEDREFRADDDKEAKEFLEEFTDELRKKRPMASVTLHRLTDPLGFTFVDHIGE